MQTEKATTRDLPASHIWVEEVHLIGVDANAKGPVQAVASDEVVGQGPCVEVEILRVADT